MPLTDAQQKALVLAQLGKTGDATYTAIVDNLWVLYEGEAKVHPQLRYLRTLEDAITTRLALLGSEAIDWSGAGVSESRSGLLKQLEALLGPTQKRIEFLMAQLRGNRAPQVGEITRQVPIQRDDVITTIEPSDRIYRGDPLRRS